MASCRWHDGQELCPSVVSLYWTTSGIPCFLLCFSPSQFLGCWSHRLLHWGSPLHTQYNPLTERSRPGSKFLDRPICPRSSPSDTHPSESGVDLVSICIIKHPKIYLKCCWNINSLPVTDTVVQPVYFYIISQSFSGWDEINLLQMERISWSRCREPDQDWMCLYE